MKLIKTEREYFNIDHFDADGVFCGSVIHGSWNDCINDDEYKSLLMLGIYEYSNGEYLENREF